jgi:hypothetical protein
MKHVVFIVVVMALGIAAGVMVMHGRKESAPVVEVDARSVAIAIDSTPIDAPVPIDAEVSDAAVAEEACDEVACVLEDYKRACCQQFRPVEEHVDAAAPPAAVDDCDEVSCVLDDYVRPCCKKFDKRSKRPEVVTQHESLDRHMIVAGVQSAKQAIAACGDRSSTKGTAKAHVKVAPSGRPSSVRVDSADAALASCITNALKAVTFEPTETGGSFTYPFVF